MEQLRCEDLTLGYEGKEIVRGLTFSVNKGDYVCIVGENGSGKSTLVKVLLGLHTPISGEVKKSRDLALGIGYLPQQTAVQRDFPASVEEIVLSGFAGRMGLRPFYTKKEKERARADMERLGVASLAKRCYRELSGGQQQRVLLARALCATGELLLLDEPVAGLDPKATAELYAIIEELNRKDGITVLMVSHDIATALTYADRILHIGHEVFFGSREEYLDSSLGRAFATGGEEK